MPPTGTPLLKARHRSLLDAIKHRGRATVTGLAGDLDLNVETVREHLRTLEAQGLVRRDGTQPQPHGRPDVIFVLTPSAEALFPRREAEVLRELARYLEAHHQGPLLRGFLAEYVKQRRADGLARVKGLKGRKRVREVARIFDEMGFLPVLDDQGETLRLCHCPIRGLVDATDLPCREEIGLLRDLLGGSLSRVSHMPDGDASCAYHMDVPA